MRKAIVITAAALVYSLSATAQTEDNMDRIEVCKQNYRTLFGGEALTGWTSFRNSSSVKYFRRVI